MRSFLTRIGYFDKSIPIVTLRRQRAFILASFFTSIILVVDFIQNYGAGYYILAYEELVMVPLFLLNYLLQRRSKISFDLACHISALLITFQMLFSMIVPGFGSEIMLFWIATLPLVLVLLIPLKQTFKANILIGTFLLLLTINAKVQWVDSLFSFEVLIQLLMGYLLFSLLVHLVEKSRLTYEDALAHRTREREVLLKEVNHRVKNNMQVIMSMLWLQSKNIEDDAYKALSRANMNRISAMAMVHESIYKVEDFERIDAAVYLKRILDNLSRFSPYTITSNIESIELSMRCAMNLGLIVNELVTNAQKHAFGEVEGAKISILLQKDDKLVVLKIKDNGYGFKNLEQIKENLGLSLVRDFATSLSDAIVQYSNDNGAVVTVIFKRDKDVP